MKKAEAERTVDGVEKFSLSGGNSFAECVIRDNCIRSVTTLCSLPLYVVKCLSIFCYQIGE